jgi:hypothetical protein
MKEENGGGGYGGRVTGFLISKVMEEEGDGKI